MWVVVGWCQVVAAWLAAGQRGWLADGVYSMLGPILILY